MAPDEREYTLDELNVGDTVVVKFRHNKKAVCVIKDINRRRKVSNNIYVAVKDDSSGKTYLVHNLHILKKISGDTAIKAKVSDKGIAKGTAKGTAKCTVRNPYPPCGPGMVERARPNGAICCYKRK